MKSNWTAGKILVATSIAAIGTTLMADTKHESPFACDRMALNAKDRKRHFDELGPALRPLVKNVRELPDGFEFQFPFDAESYRLVTEWVGGEHLCCPFFDIDLRLGRENGDFWLRLTGRDGVKQFIRTDFKPWFRH